MDQPQGKIFPPKFVLRLETAFPGPICTQILDSLSAANVVSVRVNSLKKDLKEILKRCRELSIEAETIPWLKEALVLKVNDREKLREFFKSVEGLVYQQGLSSMLVPVILDPRPGEDVLDMCAAPGSKTSQMAATMNNQGRIVCVENVRGRYFKLKAVCQLMGVENAELVFCDGRRFKPSVGATRLGARTFDKILVDAPCSSEGRFHIDNKKSFAYWSERKIKEMVKKQRGLLLNASRYLKPDGSLVYSTCTFAPEENEGVVDWFLRKTEGTFHVVSTTPEGIESYPCLTKWKKRIYNEEVKKCLRVLPNERMGGFFIAKFTRNN